MARLPRGLAPALALALLLAGPAAALAAEPRAAPPPVDGLLVRADPDGGRTLLLHVEDQPGGTYAYTPARTPAQVPDVREAGAFVHAYARADGTPMLSAGTYAVSTAQGLVRLPLVLVEGMPSSPALQASLAGIVAEWQQVGSAASPFLTELLLPELTDTFGAPQAASRFSQYKDHPTVYVWTVARSGPAGSAWAGLYLARTGSVATAADGSVARAVKDLEVGAAARLDAQTTRVAGAYVESTYEALPSQGAMAQRAAITAGLAGAAGRVPVARLALEDERHGDDLLQEPALQRSGASVGVMVQGSYQPLLGVETTQAYRPSPGGDDVTRVTSVGLFGGGAYTPVAGVRYHSDTGEPLAVLIAAALGGPGSLAPGDFEVDVGAFPTGEYVPAAGAVYRTGFREARGPHATFLGVGAYTPLGFAPLVAASYDGSQAFVDWALAWRDGKASGQGWLVAAGTSVAGAYVPLLGVEGRGLAPGGHRAQQQEVRVGTFAGDYRAFVPLASASYDADRTPLGHATGFAGGTLGSRAGDFDAGAGLYARGAYVPLVGVQYRSAWDGGEAAETAVVAGAHGPTGFVPLVGLVYEGQAPLTGSLGSPTNVRDDRPFTVKAGTFAPGGAFVPLLTVYNGPDSVRVTLGP